MKPVRYATILMLLPLTLSGCGGGSSDSHAITTEPTVQTTTLKGAVISSSYLQGATVCLDKNINLRCDVQEVQTTTNNKGIYTLKDIPSSDGINYAVIAVVPVGAIDQEATSKPIIKEYTLSAPIGKHTLISPITSIIKEYQEYSGLNTDEASQLIAELVGASPQDLFTDYAASNSNREQKRLKNLAKLATASFQNSIEKTANLGFSYTAKQRQNIAIRGFLYQVPFLLSDVSADGYSLALPAPILVSDTANQDLLKLSALPQTKVSASNFLTGNSPILAVSTKLQSTNCSGVPLTCTGAAYPSFFNYGNITFTSFQNDSYIAHENFNELNLQTGTILKKDTVTTLILGSNGWVQLPATDDDKVSVTGNVATHNSLKTPRSYTESITTGSIENISIQTYLQLTTSLTNNITNFLHALPVRSALFPKGAISYIYTTTLNADDYSLFDTNNMDTIFTAPPLSDAYHPEKTFSTLNEAEAYFQSNWFKISSNLSNLQVLLSANGELKIQKIVISLNQDPIVIDIPDKGTWQQKIVNGQILTVLRIPAYVNNRLCTDIFWTVHNGQVVQGVFAPKGRSSQNLAFNSIAFDALKAAIVIQPAPLSNE